jgi:hypothetical protein
LQLPPYRTENWGLFKRENGLLPAIVKEAVLAIKKSGDRLVAFDTTHERCFVAFDTAAEEIG